METIAQDLHWQVSGEGITDIIRQMYLYEDKEKAWNVISCMVGISIDQAKSVFIGDAFFESTLDGQSVNLVFKKDKKWKKEFRDHIKYLKEKDKADSELQRQQAMDRFAEENHDKGLNVAREFIKKAIGIPEKSPEESIDYLEEMQMKANIDISKKMFIENMYETDPEKKKVNEKFIQKFVKKTYKFIFQGHEYTFGDSARNQSQCPHCNIESSETIWSLKDKACLGYYDFKNGEVAICFECPECYEKFYYHQDKEVAEDIMKRRSK